jgi:hypothetical protein
MNGTGDFAAAQMSIGEDFRLRTVLCKKEDLPGLKQTVFEQRAKRDPRLFPFFDIQRFLIGCLHRVDSFLCDPNVFLIAFNANPVPSQFLRDGACRACPKKRSPGFEEAIMTRYRSASGFWVEWAFEPFARMRCLPVAKLRYQSERICSPFSRLSSFKAFID